MNRAAYRLVASTVFLCLAASPALAQKSGGTLRIQHFDSPASMSILEEATRAALQPMMGVFNNLVMYVRTWRRTASTRSYRISRPAGNGARTARS